MLEIAIEAGELWNEQQQEFVKLNSSQTIRLEHSLLSISKWEAKWHKPFLGNTPKTREETIDYVRCMTLTQNVNPLYYLFLSNDNIQKINDYIANPMTATTIKEIEGQSRRNSEILTNELIYYYMIALNIPFECEKWHLNRLLMLIKVCGIKNSPGKKMSKNQILSRNRQLNEARRKSLHTKG